MKRDTAEDEVKIVGFRIEKAEKEPEIDNGVPVLRANTKVTFRLFGVGFKNNTMIGLTAENFDYGSNCKMMISTGLFQIVRESSSNARVEVLLPENSAELYICATHEDGVSNHCRHFRIVAISSFCSFVFERHFIIKAMSHG